MSQRAATHPEEAEELALARAAAEEIDMLPSAADPEESEAPARVGIHGGPAAWMCAIGLGHLCGPAEDLRPGIADGFGLGLLRPER